MRGKMPLCITTTNILLHMVHFCESLQNTKLSPLKILAQMNVLLIKVLNLALHALNGLFSVLP